MIGYILIIQQIEKMKDERSVMKDERWKMKEERGKMDYERGQVDIYYVFGIELLV